MDYVTLSDLVRYYVVIASLWLIAVLLRITYTRVRDCKTLRCAIGRQQPPHPFSTLGLAVLLVAPILRRFEALGQPGDMYLWIAFTAVTLVLIGVIINVQFTFKPPWRRQEHPQ